MTGSCPVSAHVCQETARERDELAAEVVNLRNHVRALTEDVARADTLATILDGAREGLARSGSRAKGVRDVQALLTASAVREGVQGARRRVLSTRRREDRGRAASNALGLLRERDAARAEVERLRAIESGVKALADWHETKAEKADRHPGPERVSHIAMSKAATVHRDASRRLRDLLDPTEGDDRD